MDISRIIHTIDRMLDTKRKRHIVGGMLLSISMLFGGLAITTMTLKESYDSEEEQDEREDDY